MKINIFYPFLKFETLTLGNADMRLYLILGCLKFPMLCLRRGLVFCGGSNVEIMTSTEQYVPYVDFEHRAVASFEESLELIKNMSG